MSNSTENGGADVQAVSNLNVVGIVNNLWQPLASACLLAVMTGLVISNFPVMVALAHAMYRHVEARENIKSSLWGVKSSLWGVTHKFLKLKHKASRELGSNLRLHLILGVLILARFIVLFNSFDRPHPRYSYDLTDNIFGYYGDRKGLLLRVTTMVFWCVAFIIKEAAIFTTDGWDPKSLLLYLFLSYHTLAVFKIWLGASSPVLGLDGLMILPQSLLISAIFKNLVPFSSTVIGVINFWVGSRYVTTPDDLLNGVKGIVLGLVADVYMQSCRWEHISEQIQQGHLPPSSRLPCTVSFCVDMTKMTVEEGSKVLGKLKSKAARDLSSLRLGRRWTGQERGAMRKKGRHRDDHKRARQNGQERVAGAGAVVAGTRPLQPSLIRRMDLDKKSSVWSIDTTTQK